MHYKLKIVGLFIIIIGVGCSCSSDKDSSTPKTDFDVSGMLTNIADNIIIPRYSAFENDIDDLLTATNTFISIPSSTNLTTLRSAYISAHTSWQRAEIFEFGPAADLSLRSKFNLYPVDTALIESTITSSNYNLGQATYANAIGLNSIDYLLFGPNVLDSSRALFVKDLVTDLKTRISSVTTSWNNDYRSSFVQSLGTENGSSTSNLINALSLYTESSFRTGKIRIPAGIFLGNNVDTSRIEGHYSRNYSVTYIREALSGINDFYYGISESGIDGLGFDNYLQALDARNTLTGELIYLEINTDLSEAITAANTINNPYANELTTNRDAVVSLHDEVQDLLILFKIELSAAVAVSINYQDTDGD